MNRQIAQAKSRPALIALLGLNLRMMENWRQVQIAIAGNLLDYESTMILIAIVAIGAERLLRTGIEPELETLEAELPHERISNVNLSSIAAATAINRETVRRKVAELERLGLVARERDKILMGPGVLQDPIVREIIGAQLDAIMLTLRQLTRLGVLASRRSH